MVHTFRTIDGTHLGNFTCYDTGVIYCHSIGCTNYTVEFPDTSEDNSGVYEITSEEYFHE